MVITSTDIKNNFGKYIRLAAKEDIIITKNGKKVGKLTAYHKDADKSEEIVKENAQAYNYDGQKVSYEDFLEISANSDERYEYIDGEIYLLTSPKTTHQRILMELTVLFYNWFKGKKCTPMFAPYDIKLQRNERYKSVVQPDLMVICDLEEKLGNDDYYMGVPSLIVEIVSQSTKSKDYVRKADLYMCCGVAEYWIVDPVSNEVHIYLFEDGDLCKTKTFSFADEINSFYFKGFSVSLRNLPTNT